jgi:acyl carrier protein
MNRSELISVIGSVLSERMRQPLRGSFSEHALLNEHLGLDSVLVLELLVHLELEHGFALPEEAALQKQTGTIGSLADYLLEHGSRAAAAGGAP